MIMAGAIRHLQKHLANETDEEVLESLERLTAIADIVERHVTVKPK